MTALALSAAAALAGPPGFQLLFCYGHTAVGQKETYAYLGLYWTWGNGRKAGGAGIRRAILGARSIGRR